MYLKNSSHCENLRNSLKINASAGIENDFFRTSVGARKASVEPNLSKLIGPICFFSYLPVTKKTNVN